MNLYFNPLPPHGGRHRFFRRIFPQAAFQSTPSTRRETLRNRDLPRPGIHFNPLPPHGGRHAIPKPSVKESTFQSTPSTRRETCRVLESVSGKWISIHSLHTEGDMTDLFTPSPRSYFNPLPPHGGRPDIIPGTMTNIFYFNPLPPHGGRLHC